MFNVKWDSPIKRPYFFLVIATRSLECENNLHEVKAWESFPVDDFDL